MENHRFQMDDMDDLLLNISTARDLEEIMTVLRQSARRLIGADGLTFLLRESGECFYIDEDAARPLWKGQRFPMDACISGWAMRNSEVVVVDDIHTDPRMPETAQRPAFVKSLVIVPLRPGDALGAIGAYWSKPGSPPEESVRRLQRIANAATLAIANVALANSLAEARDEASRARDAMILAMASLAETRDHETGDHIRRTQHYVKVLAEALNRREPQTEGLDGEFVDLLYKSAPLHDIGKVGIPDRILQKPGRLDRAEFDIMKTHADLGRAAIATAERYIGESNPFLSLAKEIAHCHHERWDGTGYPRGLKGEDIPLAGRIMAVADVYDALVSERVYKPAMSHNEAVDLINGESGKHFDPAVVAAFDEVATQFAQIHERFGQVN
ncbi:HD domain-containing phosphohydrolase [Neorhizobium sp. NCHU2750]|uniref:HD domain-containing phosphohydrolase n=1 Tax=Neorhizobium sp. NCHU2750 TaxID=1825976 RepID=UPI000E74C58E|nr:two-component system response regulator [Neorhizobium sp. NCHU2750]